MVDMATGGNNENGICFCFEEEVMIVMRKMTRTTTIARLAIMMVATVMISFFRCSTRDRMYRMRVDKAYRRIASSVEVLCNY